VDKIVLSFLLVSDLNNARVTVQKPRRLTSVGLLAIILLGVYES